jgi:hypothetical protein
MLSAAILLIMLNKPHCSKAIRGQLWPEIANSDKTALQALARAGTLEMCVASGWGYKWERLGIRVQP